MICNGTKFKLEKQAICYSKYKIGKTKSENRCFGQVLYITPADIISEYDSDDKTFRQYTICPICHEEVEIDNLEFTVR